MMGICRKIIERFKYILGRNCVFAIFIFWMIIQTTILIANGINVSGEGERVIREANNLQTLGHFSSPAFYMYFTEIALVFILHLKLGLSYSFIVFIQLILNFTALTCFYKFMCSLYQSKKIALIGAVLLICCFPYQIYNFYLYTESIFFSLVIIFSCKLLKERSFKIKSVLILIALLLLIMFTRPTAIFVLGATCVYLYFFFSKRVQLFWRIFIFLSLCTGSLLLLNFLVVESSSSSVRGDFGIDILEPFRYEHIICGVPTVTNEAAIKTIKNSNSLNGLLYYLIHNFKQFSRLALLKTKVFFGLQRTYYSTIHNIFLAVYFYPIYICFLLAIFKIKKKTPIAFSYFIALILFFWICVMCSCDEWHNRFFITLTPFWILGALYLFKPTIQD